jgi:hypothetical protein
MNAAAKIDPVIDLAREIGARAYDPLAHCMFAFPWGEKGGPLEDFPAPRAWQVKIKTIVRDHLQDLATRFQPLRIGVASGHGIGKSAEVGMLSKWALDCWVDARVVITANTEQQLLTKTSPEVNKWHKMAITRDWFRQAAMKISSNEPGHGDSWRLDFVTWSANNTEAFAGLHNVGRLILVVTDESSNIDDKVAEVIQGALTDEGTVLIWLALGNPTRNAGWFHGAFHRHRKLWKTIQIDARTVEGTNKRYLQELVDTYGIDSDIVKVRVLGQFPSASSAQLIPLDAVQAARTRPVPDPLVSDPLVFGVDCARFGDDHSTLAIRCGRDARTRPWKRWHQVDAMTLAGDIALEAQMWKPDAIFVDVGNIGGAVIDRLRQLGLRNVFEVHFGGKGREVSWDGGVRVRTANKRSEMWTTMRSWLRNGGCIPDEQAIEDDLVGPEYGYGAGETEILLEKKAHMKSRGLASPDDADALACTFAEPVLPRVPAHRDPASYVDAGAAHDRYAELG